MSIEPAPVVTVDDKGMNNKTKVIVAIPAFNEERSIGSVVALSKKYADAVFVVDDGSRDKTADIAKIVGAEVVAHSKNSGYGAAIRTCFQIAKDQSADVLVTIDADGQHDADEIPLLLDSMKRNKSDIVIGSRFVGGNGAKRNIPTYRKVGMKILDNATMAGSGLHITDSQSGFRAYSRNAISSIDLSIDGMGAGSEILITAAEKHLSISEVPINVRYDIKGTSSESPIIHGFSVINSILKLIAQKKPLLFFGIPSLILIAIGVYCWYVVYNLYTIYKSIAMGNAIIGMVCILVAVFTAFTAIMLWSIQNIQVRTR